MSNKHRQFSEFGVMLQKQQNNYAYIDGANLHKGIFDSGWILDYARFRVWLTEKYGVKNAYIFIGLIPRYKELYKYLQESGFTLIFKEVIYDGDGKPKGNCDADLVLQATSDAYENKFEKAVVVSSDGDYAGLIKFLKERGKLRVILSPHAKDKCSILIKRTDAPITYLNDVRVFIKKEKAPDADKTTQGSFS
ncbi:MAG: hypothetical protein UU49_C0009G0011 [Candidatus Magasanikbacteria bacterium GW2011_GWC2_41_17]|uniref:NYN domain-containing protein n=1 Tax=Candidatus Magasanikbacteria bacterium GW2011_GWC2_41_17 TaxID=1619048 RepID=A0A0G0VEA3_9BACT|nr:MAG: hypothetical protein UU49_C0009G0011 [Candidatus Magasanikbacteria bacterium GW2011_GWC2_41_17]